MPLILALLLLLLLFSAPPRSATTTCPTIDIKLKSQELSSAFSLFPVSFTCSSNLNLLGRSFRFTTPPITTNYSILLESVWGGYAAIEVRHAADCSTNDYTVVACDSGTSITVGWMDLALIPNQQYIIVVFTNGAAPPQKLDKLLIAKSCASLSLDPAAILNSTTRAVNITLSSASAVVDKSPCGITTSNLQTMHVVEFFPPVAGWYSLLVRNFDGGDDSGGVTVSRGFLEILEGACISIARAPSFVSSSSLFCKSALNTLGTESIYLERHQMYTIRVGNFPSSDISEVVTMPDDKNVFEVSYVNAHGGGLDGTCLDTPAPATKKTSQAFELSASSWVNVDFTCVRYPSFARYASYTPSVTGNYYVRALYNLYTRDDVRHYAIDRGRYVELLSVLLYSNTTYVIRVSDWYNNKALRQNTTVKVEVGLVDESRSQCTDNELVSTPHYQTTELTTQYTHSGWLPDTPSESRDSATALYTSFKAPFTGNYFARVFNTTAPLGVTVRAGSCQYNRIRCGTIYSATKGTKVGLDTVYMEAGQKYVIFVCGVRGVDLYALVGETVELGYCGNMCAYTARQHALSTAPFGSAASVLQYNLATVVAPGVFFLVALVLGLWLCLQDGGCRLRAAGDDGGVPMAVAQGAASMLPPLRRLCLTCAVLAVGVWVSGWAVFWSVMAYPLSVLVCIYALRMARESSTEHAFAVSRFALESTNFQRIFVVSGVLLLGNAVVAFVQTSQQMTDGLAFCNEYYAGNQACVTSVTLNPVYGVLAAVAMVALGVCSIQLGQMLHSIAEAMRLDAMRSAFGDVPEAEVVRGPHASQPPMAQPAAVVTFRTQQQQQQQQQYARGTVLAEEVAEEDEDLLCQICFDARTTRIFNTCGHCTCEACAEKIVRNVHKKCPFCNQPIKSVLAFF